MSRIKPFLSVSQQIYKLRSQGLRIYCDDKTKDILRTHSYYSFVNGYCDLLVISKHPRVFKEGATFKELTAIYNFDTSFRRFLFPEILFIEEKIKATCINVFCGKKKDGKYVHEGDKYLSLDSYETLNQVKLEAAKKIIKDFKRAIKSNKEKNNPAFVYALDNYGYVPFWILTTNLSFGQISRFYECLHYDVRVSIARRYHLTEKDLRAGLKIINAVRNLCAHNNRVYTARIPNMLPSALGDDKHRIYVDPLSNHHFGSMLYILKFLLSENKFNKLITALSTYLTDLNSQLTTVSIKQVLKRMGISPMMVKNMGITIN